MTLARQLDTAWCIYRREGLPSLLKATLGHAAAGLSRIRHKQRVARLLPQHLDADAYVVVSTIEWDFPYKQRPQHLATAIGSLGRRCLYFAPLHRIHGKAPGSEVATNVYVYYAKADLPAFLSDRHTVVLLSTDNSLDRDFVNQVRQTGARIVYDYIDVVDDAISLQAIGHKRRDLHRELLRDPAVLCLASAQNLYEEVLGWRSENTCLLTNGVEYKLFADARRGARRPPELDGLPAARSIVGYHGALAAWLDYELVAETARLRQDDLFVLIGPDYDGSSSNWRPKMPDNVIWLPPVDYGRIAEVSVWFDVCMVPFARSALTDAVSPLKLFEYLALGKPVIATDFSEVRQYDPVLKVSSAAEFAAAVEQADGLRTDEDFIAACRAIALENSWQAKAEQLMAQLGEQNKSTLTSGAGGS